jgi:hypothetical protein
LALASTALWVAPQAHAELSGPLTIELIAPGGTSFGDAGFTATATGIDPSMGLSAGDLGNDISEFWMLTDEAITFSGNDILIRVAAGDDFPDLITGYLGDSTGPARYEISGLSVAPALSGPAEQIVGLQAWSFDGYATSGAPLDSGLLDPSAFTVTLVGSDQVNIQLDNLVFRDRGGFTSDNYAEFRISLITAPVPEPGTWALWMAGLAGVAFVARRRAPGRG